MSPEVWLDGSANKGQSEITRFKRVNHSQFQRQNLEMNYSNKSKSNDPECLYSPEKESWGQLIE
jgi:hypothetical protein